MIGTIGAAGLVFQDTPRIVGKIFIAFSIGNPLFFTIGVCLFIGSLIAWPLARFITLRPVARRALGWVAAASILACVAAPLVSLWIFETAPASRLQRYYVEYDPQYSGQILLTDATGSQMIVTRGRRTRWPSNRTHECIDARRVDGALGMSWMRVVAMTPRPTRGQMWWDVTRKACFEAGSLADLAER